MAKPSKYPTPEPTTTTIHVEPFLMPIAIVLASCMISTSMFASFWKLGDSIQKQGTVVGNDNTAGIVDGNTIPTDNIVPEPTTAVVSLDDDSVKGDKNAKIAIVEFSDYECPFCGRFYDETLPQLLTDYIDTGKVALVYRDLPLSFHTFAQKQAEAAECAGEQGKYFDMHNYIFENGGQLSVDALKEGAKTVGLDTSKFNSCLDNGDMVAEITKDANDAAAAGINGTPGFVVGTLSSDGTVDGQIISGAMPFETFKAAIDSYLE